MLRAVGALTLVALVATSGCGTVVALQQKTYQPYDGVALDSIVVVNGFPKGPPPPRDDLNVLSLWPLAIIDVPLSAVADTLLLPVAIARTLAERKSAAGPPALHWWQQQAEPDQIPAPDRSHGGIRPGF